jgi:hypothetical protein
MQVTIDLQSIQTSYMESQLAQTGQLLRIDDHFLFRAVEDNVNKKQVGFSVNNNKHFLFVFLIVLIAHIKD